MNIPDEPLPTEMETAMDKYTDKDLKDKDFKKAQTASAPAQKPLTDDTPSYNDAVSDILSGTSGTDCISPGSRPKRKWVAFFLCLFLGPYGIHKFYEGKIGMGILYLLTMGIFGIGWIVDLFILLFRPNPYYV